MRQKALLLLLFLSLSIFLAGAALADTSSSAEMASSATSSVESAVSVEKVLKFGTSCALKGISSYLGKEYVGGIRAYIDMVNRKGGVNGYKIKLVVYDDGYEPGRCKINTMKLINEDKVLALVGYTGTPTSKVALPYAEKKGVPFLFPYTGASFLREKGRNLVFNLRASYVEEMVSLCKFFKDMKLSRIAVFYQDDAFGRAGLKGVKEGLAITGLKLVGEAVYKRNTMEIMATSFYMADLRPDAVLCIGTFQQVLSFVKYTCFMEDKTNFGIISFANPVEIMRKLKCGKGRVYGVSCVPSPYDANIPLVEEYKKNIGKVKISPISLEGYMAGKVLVEGIKRAFKLFGKVDRRSLVKGLEELDVDIGGVRIRFSPSDHQALHRVWILGERNGKIQTIRTYGK